MHFQQTQNRAVPVSVTLCWYWCLIWSYGSEMYMIFLHIFSWCQSIITVTPTNSSDSHASTPAPKGNADMHLILHYYYSLMHNLSHSIFPSCRATSTPSLRRSFLLLFLYYLRPKQTHLGYAGFTFKILQCSKY